MVLSAGEIGFVREAGRWAVSEIGNRSTGYRPDVGSWADVARALDAVELRRPSGFIHFPTLHLTVAAPPASEHEAPLAAAGMTPARLWRSAPSAQDRSIHCRDL
ncbi:hypothetical protein [Streptomyces pini]|uniref:Uncharacterized protein n=1 Tax=Streptomyces pini TaxID=1520580 RepID=A0A1I3XXP3_9ACTN|nr:hypothetical protein SAMN05192584_104360 [Streptomyces pini]